MKKIIAKNAPAPVGPYSHAILKKNMLFISGQLPVVPETKELIKNDIQKEATQALDNLGAILKEAGMDYSSVVKCTIFITDMSLFAKVNEVYSLYFSEPFPARETVQVSALPLGANLEISAIAMK
ncbi:MAG: RidA family protein [Bacteroidales bacterium]